MEIEYKDERNELIRDKANAKAGDIYNLFVLLIAYICIIMDYPTWLILFILCVFSLKYILWILQRLFPLLKIFFMLKTSLLILLTFRIYPQFLSIIILLSIKKELSLIR